MGRDSFGSLVWLYATRALDWTDRTEAQVADMGNLVVSGLFHDTQVAEGEKKRLVHFAEVLGHMQVPLARKSLLALPASHYYWTGITKLGQESLS